MSETLIVKYSLLERLYSLTLLLNLLLSSITLIKLPFASNKEKVGAVLPVEGI